MADAGRGLLSGTKVLVNDTRTKSELKDRLFGEDETGRLELSLIEAAYLVDTGKLEVNDGKKNFGFNDLVTLGSGLETEFYNKYKVFSDLRNRGLVVRTGFKFGADFRVYERGKSLSVEHSTILVHVIPEEYTCSFPELARAIRLAGNVNKDMIYAIVDEESDITYYKVERVRL